ncbi:Gibberellin 2-beta-dioxygenase [Dionaea muscipula]
MVVQSQPAAAVLDRIPSLTKPCKQIHHHDDDELMKSISAAQITKKNIPIVDLASPDAIPLAVKACEEFGFFKAVNHGVPAELMTRLEDEATRFFSLTTSEKENRVSPASPFGYGNKRIGPNGDVGWVEYLLLSATPDYISHISHAISPQNPDAFRTAATSYIAAVKRMTCRVLELLAEGLKVGRRDAFSRLLEDEKSDSYFRLNHYPPCPTTADDSSHDQPAAALPLMSSTTSTGKLIGFGEHTDPQIISVLRSNNTAGLQILLSDGTTWLSVPPDSHSFFINVGDSLQVMTNGRFKSVKHRVLAGGMKSRISMIYFGGPAPYEKITPLESLMDQGEESLYEEFTWWEYKKAAYRSKLGDNRLAVFKRSRSRDPTVTL